MSVFLFVFVLKFRNILPNTNHWGHLASPLDNHLSGARCRHSGTSRAHLHAQQLDLHGHCQWGHALGMQLHIPAHANSGFLCFWNSSCPGNTHPSSGTRTHSPWLSDACVKMMPTANTIIFFLYQFSHKLIASFGRLIDLRENRWWPQLLHAHLQYLKTQLNTFWPYCCNFYIFQLLELITRINHKHPFPMDFHSEGCLR